MYENPKLNRIGNAEDVILGFLEGGEDLDANYVPTPQDYAPESEYD